MNSIFLDISSLNRYDNETGTSTYTDLTKYITNLIEVEHTRVYEVEHNIR